MKLERLQEDESLIAAIVAKYLDKRKGHVQAEETGCEYKYRIQADQRESAIDLRIKIVIAGKTKSLSMRIGVVSEKNIPCVMVIEDTGYFDLLHNYALDDRHEILEAILSAAYVLTPPNTELYLPLSEQAKAALKAKRKNDRSLLSLQKITENAGFPLKYQRYEKIGGRHFLRCKKSVILV